MSNKAPEASTVNNDRATTEAVRLTDALRVVMDAERHRVGRLSRERITSLKGGATEQEIAQWQAQHPHPGDPEGAALAAAAALVEDLLATQAIAHAAALAEADAGCAERVLREAADAMEDPYRCSLGHGPKATFVAWLRDRADLADRIATDTGGQDHAHMDQEPCDAECSTPTEEA